MIGTGIELIYIERKFENMLPKNIEKTRKLLISINDFLFNIDSGTIKYYTKNRGGNGLIKKHIQTIVDNFDLNALGCIVIEDMNDGTYTLRDGHNRAESIKIRRDKGLFTKEELDTQIVLQIVPFGKGISTYVNLNNSRKHTTKNALNNNDLYYSKLIEEISAKTYSSGSLKKNFRCVLADLIMANKNGKLDQKWSTVYNERKEVGDFTRVNKNITLPEEEKQKIADCLNYYYTLRSELSRLNGGWKVEINRFLINAGFFGMIISDRMRINPRMTYLPAKKLAEKIFKKSSILSVSVPQLTKNAPTAVEDFIQNLGLRN